MKTNERLPARTVATEALVKLAIERRAELFKSVADLLNRPLGAKLIEIAERGGLTRTSMMGMAQRARRDGQLFIAGENKHARYFSTEAARDIGAALMAKTSADSLAARIEVRRLKNTANSRIRREREKASRPPPVAKPPKPPKPIIFAKPKPAKNDTRSVFKNQEAYTPPNVKRTVWPTPPDRFDPSLTAELVFSSMRPGQYL